MLLVFSSSHSLSLLPFSFLFFLLLRAFTWATKRAWLLLEFFESAERKREKEEDMKERKPIAFSRYHYIVAHFIDLASTSLLNLFYSFWQSNIRLIVNARVFSPNSFQLVKNSHDKRCAYINICLQSVDAYRIIVRKRVIVRHLIINCVYNWQWLLWSECLYPLLFATISCST